MIQRRLLIRCDGGNIPEIGTGHVRRCLALAEELARFPGTELVFLMRPTPWVDRVRDAGHEVIPLQEDEDLNEQLVRVAAQRAIQVLLLDTLDRSVGAIGALQAEGRIVITLDDPSDEPLGDISISPAFPGPGSTHVELDRTIFLEPLRPRTGEPATNRVLACFGGFDPHGIALQLLRAWIASGDTCPLLLAVGTDSTDLDELQELAQGSPTVRVATDVNLAEELPRASLALVNGGTTLFMAAAHGTPSLAVAQYGHQAGNAKRLEEAGASRFFGNDPTETVDAPGLVKAARELLQSEARLEAMSLAGRMLFPGRGKRELAQTLAIVEPLPWDSDFFGLQIATLHPRRLTERILKFALEACRSEAIDCLYFLADSAHAPTRALAEENGFRAVDDRLTYLRSTHEIPAPPCPEGVALRTGQPEDSQGLGQIAGTSYGASRYFHDGRFPQERCEQFYRDWIQKSLRGEFDDEVLVAESGGQIAGYISCRANTPNLGSIGLVGLDPKFRGRGIGRALVAASLAWFKERDIPRVEVVTQGRNEVAQKLYESCGFVLHRREKWYHCWFDEPRNEA